MPSGKVKFYDEAKGFGFIQQDDGQEVFLHASVLPDGAAVKAGTRIEYSVAEGRKGAQALSVRIIEVPAAVARPASHHQRKPADDMAVIVEDLVKVLDGIGSGLKRGRYPERAQARKIAEMLRRVADEMDA